jgi:hypothetical protein
MKMKDFFGSNPWFKIRKRGSHRLMTLDVKASRAAPARWSAGIWTRVVQYANGTLSKDKDAANILALMHDLGWSPPSELSSREERRALVSRIIKEAREIRTQVGKILCWIATPGEDAESDRRAVEMISEHSHGVKLQLIHGQVVGKTFEGEHFLDSISRFVCDSLHQISKDLARLPEPSPIRICKIQDCHQFFVRDRKHIHCEEHRGAKASRSTDENRRYKFIRDNLRTPIHKLKKKIKSSRVARARDGVWKLKCLIQIHIDRTNGNRKRPTDYLRVHETSQKPGVRISPGEGQPALQTKATTLPSSPS